MKAPPISPILPSPLQPPRVSLLDTDTLIMKILILRNSSLMNASSRVIIYFSRIQFSDPDYEDPYPEKLLPHEC